MLCPELIELEPSTLDDDMRQLSNGCGRIGESHPLPPIRFYDDPIIESEPPI
jgi:hypothetical protein